jgi:hypothetical protein
VQTHEIRLLAKILKQKFRGETKKIDYERTNPALNLLDCVLSLNRNYDKFVVPRINNLSRRHPNLSSLASLKKLIHQYATPLEFSVKELNYKDSARAKTLLGVLDYLLAIQQSSQNKTEIQQLKQWALKVQPSDYKAVNVRGFGLAGFQYLRMLFGVETTKPDIHIRRFVSETIGRKVSDREALSLLEMAAKLARVSLRVADFIIWEERARSKTSN